MNAHQRPERGDIGSKRFIVLSHPRSGTNFLREILVQHPKAFMASEAFHADPALRPYVFNQINAFRPSGAPCFTAEDAARQFTLDDLDGFFTRCAQGTQREAVGFTLFSQAMGHGLSDEEVTRAALREDVLPILLVRRNLLKAWVSLKRACATGAWHLDGSGTLRQYPGLPSTPTALIRWIDPIDLAETQAFIQETRRFMGLVQAALEKAGKPWLTVHYEDLCLGGPDRTHQEIDRILAFLGLDPLPSYEIRLFQTAAGEFYDAIPNRQELMDATGYDLAPPPSSPHGWVARTQLWIEQRKAEGKTIALAPAGRFARSLLDLCRFQGARFVGLFDRAPGAAHDGFPVRPYSELQRVRPDVVLVASPLREDEIVLELLNQGYSQAQIVRLSELPSA